MTEGAIPDLISANQGRDVILLFDNDFGNVFASLDKEVVYSKNYLSMAAFHAPLQHHIEVPTSIIGLLPLLMTSHTEQN